MSDYESIHGTRVKYLTSDPTLDSSYEGQVWYNSTSGTNKALVQIKAYSSSGNMSNSTGGAAGFGVQTAAVRAGGESSTASISATEEYSGFNWSSGGALPAIQYQNDGAGTLTAGLSIGGFNPPPGHSTDTLEYDGSSWTAGGALPGGRHGGFVNGIQTAALYAGGDNANPGYLTETLEYDGSSWTTGGALNLGKRQGLAAGTQTAAIAAGGRLGPGPNTADNQLYDGSTWTTVNSMNTARKYLAGFGTQTHTIGAGGYTTTNTTQTEEWDGTNWAVNPATLATARGMNETSGNAPANAGVTFGGTGPLTAATEEYNSNINAITKAAWASGGNANTARRTIGSTEAGSQDAFIVYGGFAPSGFVNNSETYDGSSWTEGNNLNYTRGELSGFGTLTTAVGCGGTPPSAGVNVTEEYNGTSWSPVNNMNQGKKAHDAAGSLTAGISLGGDYPGSPSAPASLDTEEYDGTTWTTGTNMGTARRNSGATGTQTAALGAGGYNGTTNISTVESYDGSTWTAVNSLPFARAGSQMMGGLTGQANSIIVSGRAPSSITGCEQWDGTNWSATASMATGRFGFGAGGSTSAGIAGLGDVPSPTMLNSTEEFTGGTEVITASTLTTS